jgi:exonuclease SbcD
MVELVRKERIDLLVSGGDIYERASTSVERAFSSDWLIAMADVCPVVVAKGNHDRHRDCEILAKLRTRHPIHVEERAGVVVSGGVAVAAMAWPERASLLSEVGDTETTSNVMRDLTRDVLRGLGAELSRHDLPRVLLGHFMVDGSTTSTGQPLLGMPINVSLNDLALAGASLGVMGHIHKEQSFDVGGAPHLYVGSPFRTDFGQTERKVVVVAEFEGQKLVNLEYINTPCADLYQFVYDWDGEAGFFTEGGVQVIEDMWPWLANSEVRLRYNVSASQREAASRAANETADKMRELGAVMVKVEERLHVVHRARAPEVATANGIVAKLEAHWRSIGFDPGSRRESILRKAVQLEMQARAS